MELLREMAVGWGIDLGPQQLALFERYYRELLEWNQRVNLTRITGYRDVQVRHFLDSLSLLRVMDDMPSAAAERVVDVGAGAGLPGLALRIARPELGLTLLESTARKAEFLRHVTAALELSGVEVVVDRAETLAHQSSHRERYMFAVARALADLPVALELTLPFVRVGGRVILPRKGDLAADVAQARVALEALGGRHLSTVPVQLPGTEDGRGLVVVEKIARTEARYPRRAGVPGKRPLR